MAEIELRNRKRELVGVALVDDEDYERVLAAGPWHKDSAGYACHSVYLGGGRAAPHFRRERMARFVLGIQASQIWVDHRDGDPLNNQNDNLRTATAAENNQNVPKRTGRF